MDIIYILKVELIWFIDGLGMEYVLSKVSKNGIKFLVLIRDFYILVYIG